eukprot:2548338-Rhodomonas_salina.3
MAIRRSWRFCARSFIVEIIYLVKWGSNPGKQPRTVVLSRESKFLWQQGARSVQPATHWESHCVRSKCSQNHTPTLLRFWTICVSLHRSVWPAWLNCFHVAGSIARQRDAVKRQHAAAADIKTQNRGVMHVHDRCSPSSSPLKHGCAGNTSATYARQL